MLVGKTERRDIPHEVGQWFEFRQLSGVELDEAEQVQTKASLAMISGLDEAALASLRAQAGTAREGPAPDKYDKATLLKYAVAGWSYGEPCTLANVAKLDALTRDWAVGVVLEMNTRPLAITSGGEATYGNGASRENSGSHISVSTLE